MKKISFFVFLLLSLLLVSCEKEEVAPTGAFSVDNGKYVLFSPGNLQYHCTEKMWRFAPTQYDAVGLNNSKIADNFEGWIDQFGWGTGNSPMLTSTDNSDYQTFVDWGCNKIDNDVANEWRSLSYKELYYLIFTRKNHSSHVGIARIQPMVGDTTKYLGLILLPDTWQKPADVAEKAFVYGMPESYSNIQSLDAHDWLLMEKAGAIFLPLPNYHYRTGVDCQNGYIVEGTNDMSIENCLKNGAYWTSGGNYDRYPANCYKLYSSFFWASSNCLHQGRMVRLVKDVK